VDTRPPQIAGSLSGVPGANGWYISQVTIGASAADPAPGSGLEALTYILDGSPQSAYSHPLVLSDGVHSLQFTARDNAGLTHLLEQTVRVDTTPPSLNIDTSLPAWSRGVVTLTGSAADDGSGLAQVEITFDGGSTWRTVTGTNSWSFDWDTTSGVSGPTHARLRSIDMAGLQTEQALSAGVDNSPPKVSLPDSWLQWDAVPLDVWDNDSGLSEVRVEISDPEGRWKTRKIDLDPNGFPLNFKWDRYFGDGTVAPLGTYPVKVIAYDNLGNLTQKTSTARILLGILPGGPTATPQPYVRIDSTPMPASTQGSFFTPTAVSTPVTNVFGSLPETQDKPATLEETIPAIAVTPRAAPTQTTVMDWLESIFIPDSTGETVTDTRTPVTDPSLHWGATLAAMAAAVTAYSLAEKRKREEEERPLSDLRQKTRLQKTQDMKAKEALMHEIAQLQAEQKRPKAESEALMREIALFEAEQIRLEAEKEALKQRKEKDRLSHIRTSSKEEMLERERINHPANPLEGQTATAMTGMDIYRASERAKYEPTPPKKKNWWEKTLSWIDDHQVEISLGIGLAVGVAALVISGGAATPLVAAAWIAGAAAVAGGSVAIGTVGLNAYYNRPLTTNVFRNLAIAGVTAAAVTGGGFLFQGAATTASIYCANNPEKCTKIEPLLKGIDYAEQAFLQAKLVYQIWAGDTLGALETRTELALENQDGGMPGNVLAHQVKDLGEDALQIVATYGDDAIPLIAKYGNDAVEIIGAYGDEGISLLQLYGNDAVELIRKHGTPAVEILKTLDLEAAQILLTTLDDDVLNYAIDQGPDAVAALSGWSKTDLLEFGPELALRAKNDARVLQDIRKLVDLRPIDLKNLTDEQQGLINSIAEYSIQYNNEGQIVLGKWVDYGNGFTRYARETGSIHYNPHPNMWKLLGDLGDKREETAWLVNKQVIQTGIDKGLPFEYTLEGVPSDDVFKEKNLVQLIFSGASDAEIKSTAGVNKLAIRWQELKELQKAGYEFVFDEINNSFVLSLP